MNKLIFYLCVFLLSNVLIAQKRPMTTDDGLNMVQLGGAKIAPDASRILFTKSELDWDENKRKSKHYSISKEGSDEYQFLGGESDSDIQFSPDGKYIAFKRSVDKKSQVFRMRSNGGEAVQWSKHPESVSSYAWTPDSQSIIFLANEEKSKEDKKEEKDGYDHVYIDEGPNGQRKSSWRHLFQLSMDTSKAQAIINKDLRIGQFKVHPDGQLIAYTARSENRRNQGNLSEIYLFNLQDSMTKQITNNASPESSLEWAPNGRTLSFMTEDMENWELKNDKIWTYDLADENVKLISRNFEGNIRGYYWSADSKSIYFNGLQRTNTNVYHLNVDNGQFENLTNETGTWRILDMTPDRSAAVLTFDDYDTPRDLYFSPMPVFNPTKLTDLNPWVAEKIELAEMELTQWNSSDGLEIEGLVYKPVDFKADASDPFLLHIHGGPAGVFTNSFSYRYHVWAGLGYVQLAPNVRGSSGYTDDLLRGNMNDIGGGDYEDLITGVKHLESKQYIHPEHQAVRGWSYGGILGGTVVTKTDRFKAASLGAMVSDWTSEYGIGFNYDVRLWYIGGTPWDNAQGYRNKSPLTSADKVTTPVLLMHGANDRTDTEAQSMMFFAALKDLGKEVKYIQFPREPHGFREPRHQRTRDLEEIQWIQKHTLNKDWTPWERKTKKKEEEKKDKA